MINSLLYSILWYCEARNDLTGGSYIKQFVCCSFWIFSSRYRIWRHDSSIKNIDKEKISSTNNQNVFYNAFRRENVKCKSFWLNNRRLALNKVNISCLYIWLHWSLQIKTSSVYTSKSLRRNPFNKIVSHFCCSIK